LALISALLINEKTLTEQEKKDLVESEKEATWSEYPEAESTW